MAKRKKRKHDFSVTAFRIVQEATGQTEPQEPVKKKDFDAKALGRLGGRKSGKARAAKLKPEQRSDIARLAASVRWRKKAS